MAKEMAVWLTRNKYLDGTVPDYALRRRKPKNELSDYASVSWESGDEGVLSWFCPKYFERVTGFHIEPGECVRVKINVELLKPAAKPKKKAAKKRAARR